MTSALATAGVRADLDIVPGNNAGIDALDSSPN